MVTRATFLSQRAGMQHTGFAQGKNRDLHCRHRFVETAILKRPDGERIIALLFSGDGVAEHLGRTAELCDAMEFEIGGRDSVDLVRGVPIAQGTQGLSQAAKVLRLLFGVDKALIPDFDRRRSVFHRLRPSLGIGAGP